MWKRKHCLEKLFNARMTDLIEQDRHNNRDWEVKQKLAETENQRIGKSAPEFSVLEHRFKMQQSHPGTVPQAHIIAVIAKRQSNASHWQITKNNIPQENWQQQRIQHPVIFQLLANHSPPGGVHPCPFFHKTLPLHSPGLFVSLCLYYTVPDWPFGMEAAHEFCSSKWKTFNNLCKNHSFHHKYGIFLEFCICAFTIPGFLHINPSLSVIY